MDHARPTLGKLTQEGPRWGTVSPPPDWASGGAQDAGSTPHSLGGLQGTEARCADPSPSAQHDDAPGLGVYPAVVTVRPDTCGEAEGLVTLREAWTDA